ncbi:hypothetical protein PFISCL1PPCAC_21044, partial [Pristionchus fissidentatus]
FRNEISMAFIIPNDENEGIPSDNFLMRIGNVQSLDIQGVDSPTKTISGFIWTLNMFKCHAEQLCMMLSCEREGDDYPEWFCCLTAYSKLINFEDDALSRRQKFSIRVDWANDEFMESVIGFKQLIEPNTGFVRNNAITIEVRLELARSGISRMPLDPLDFSTPSRLADVTLIVEGEKLHVGKQVL